MRNEGTTSGLLERLSRESGPEYWRSLDELQDGAEIPDGRYDEFPEGASEFTDPLGRRHFLKLMGASLAMAGVQGCISGPPLEEIVPYVEQAERVVPGRPSFYATSFPFRGFAQGVLAESHEGRPTKIEGNPEHPANLGGTNVFMQASVLDLYDPNRSRSVRRMGNVSSVDAFYAALAESLRQARADGGAGVRILTEKVTSPTLGDQLGRFFAEYPNARWHLHEPVSARHVEDGLQRVFGVPQTPLYQVEAADVIVALDSDFLFGLPGSLRYARMFAGRRRVREGAAEMNRLYAVESTATITGAAADYRLPLPPSEVYRVVRALAAGLDVAEGPPVSLDGRVADWAGAVARDLQNHQGRSLVIAGESLPPDLQALTVRINRQLGNVGRTLSYVEPVDARPPGGHATLERLVEDMKAGLVESLLLFGGNPVYTAPADLEFEAALRNVPLTAHLSLHDDETSQASTWHLPRTHYLEHWSDLRAFDGTASVVQPLIAPLYVSCLSDHDLASMLLGEAGRPAYETVRATWRDRLEGPFEEAWHAALRLGYIPGTGALSASSDSDGTGRSADTPAAQGPATASGLLPEPDSDVGVASPPLPPGGEDALRDGTIEVVFRPDPSIWDGSYATNNWLQELPKPLTKLVWDNAILLGPDLAAREGIANEQVLELTLAGRSVTGPAFVTPGHPDHTVTIHLGYGRPRAGDASGKGFNAYLLRTTEAAWTARGASMQVRDEFRLLATTQRHHSMEGRKLVEEASIEQFRQNPDFIHADEPDELPTLLPEYEYPRNKWGMTIDLNVCIGCNACITACQAKNNIPVVGKDQVRRGREMHWLRVDRYYKGPLQNPETFFQPVPCMHCEKAPCEVVCPVYATVHDAEGLNVMVYNRCVGTRYCSNNCPYKVRRFNFLQYSDWSTDVQSLQKNPDVTVRSRGVMEKCTYCVQRISAARIRAKKEERAIRDGEVRTACQTACPTEAIVFGDLAMEESRVQHLERQPHNYKLLREQGTRPRTSYLAHFRSTNEAIPEIENADHPIDRKEHIEAAAGPRSE